MMRLLADENFPGPAVEALERDGHDLVAVSRVAQGMLDTDIFAWAVRDDRIILTFDKGFGDISRTTPASSLCGVILFRRPVQAFKSIGDYIAGLINERSDWAGHLSVVDGGTVRRRPLLRAESSR